ncbi:MAG: hypothetical protein GY850_09485 [bacterium]|nr:hypothetical protein [bacterium]
MMVSENIHTLAIVGAGTMGSRIACRCVLAGLNTRLFDNDPAALIKAVGNIDDWLAAKIDTDGLAHKDVADARARLHACNTLENCVADADLIIEKMAVGRKMNDYIRDYRNPYLFQFVMGYQTSSYATPKNLLSLINELPANSIFEVAGLGPFQMPMVVMSVILGGHVRVGLEDNVYLKRGQLYKSNAEAVEHIVHIAGDLNREIATPGQAGEMLGLSLQPSQY